MIDNIVDDINALLDLQKGDIKILEQIKRAAVNNEVISNYERGYVRGLAEKYLGKKIIQEKKIEAPDVILPPQKPITAKTETITLQSKKTNPRTKVYIGIGVAIFAAILIAGVGMSNVSFDTSNSQSDQTDSLVNVNLKTDIKSYNTGDIISISGNSDPSLGNKISLSIKNPSGILVWSENVSVKSSGKFSTLAIAGGENWVSGKYTLESLHGSKKTTTSFQFAS